MIMSRIFSAGMGLVLFLGGGASLFGQSDETMDRRFTTDGTPEIYVRNEDGDTEIRARAGNETRVRVRKEVRGASGRTAEEAAEEVKVEINQEGDRIEVIVRQPRRNGSFWNDRRVLVHIDITAPPRSDLDVGTDDGPLTVEGIEGNLRLHTEDGDLRISGCSGDLEVRVDDGDLDVVGFRGAIDARTEDGEVTLRGSLSSLRAESDDGSLRVRLEPDSAMTEDWLIRTSDGRVRMELPDDFAADLDIRVDDGSIDIDHPVTIQGELSRDHIRTELNGGGHELRIRTDDGSVRILKIGT